MTGPSAAQNANTTLTDGTGVSALTVPKVVKDFVVDFVKSLSAVLIASNIGSVQVALDQPHQVGIAVLSALLSTGYRFILSWGN